MTFLSFYLLVVLSTSSPGFPKVFLSSFLDIGCFFHSFSVESFDRNIFKRCKKEKEKKRWHENEPNSRDELVLQQTTWQGTNFKL